MMTTDSNTSVHSRLPLLLAIVTLLLHLGVNVAGGYGYFRDELYYIACTNRPDTGYVDHPPLSIWILSVNRLLFGDSVFALRLLPAIAGALTVYVTGIFVRRLGGGSNAQALACLAVVFAPIRLGMFGYFSMNSFDILLWSAAILQVFVLLTNERRTDWLMLGIIFGLGILNKISMSWLMFGFYAGVAATPYRRWFRTAGPWMAGAVAAAIAAPFIYWNITHEFAHVEFARRAAQLKYASQTPVTFFTGLFVIFNPFALPLWPAGLWFLLRESRFRVLGMSIAAVLAILVVNVHSKAEYFAPAFPLLCAAGVVWWERILSVRSGRHWGRSYAVVLVISGIALMPLALPVLPVGTFIRYQAALPLSPPSTEGQRLDALPQHYADRFGWREMADSVAVVFRRLTPAEQRECVVVCSNYGEASAIEFFGKSAGLPFAMSQHNAYFFWGFKEWNNPGVVIAIRRDGAELRAAFERVEEAGSTFAPLAIPHENGRKIWICRKLLVPFESAWRSGKVFI